MNCDLGSFKGSDIVIQSVSVIIDNGKKASINLETFGYQ
jgi:hypothetical protein